MRAGFGKVEITPPLGVELAGYGYYLGRKCDSVRDPLYLRAVLLEDGENRQLLISCDLLGLSQGAADRMKEEAARFGIPRNRVMIVSVHTHTGPSLQYHLGCGETDDAYLASFPEKIRPALTAAAENLAEVTRLAFTRVALPGDYLYNRAAPEGPVDRDARGFLLERGEQRPILLGSAACHGVFLERVSSVSADFSGEFHRHCAEAGFDSLYLNGLCGDIDPWQPSPDRMREFGRILFDALRAPARDLPRTLTGGRLPFTLRRVPLNREETRELAENAVRKEGGPEKPAARVALAWEKEMLSRADTLTEEEPGEASWCVLGGIPILAIPFEGFTAIGIRFRQDIGNADALVLGCAEQLRGYLPTLDDFARESYASRESNFLYRQLPPRAGEAERLAEQLAAGFSAADTE